MSSPSSSQLNTELESNEARLEGTLQILKSSPEAEQLEAYQFLSSFAGKKASWRPKLAEDGFLEHALQSLKEPYEQALQRQILIFIGNCCSDCSEPNQSIAKPYLSILYPFLDVRDLFRECVHALNNLAWDLNEEIVNDLVEFGFVLKVLQLLQDDSLYETYPDSSADALELVTLFTENDLSESRLATLSDEELTQRVKLLISLCQKPFDDEQAPSLIDMICEYVRIERVRNVISAEDQVQDLLNALNSCVDRMKDQPFGDDDESMPSVVEIMGHYLETGILKPWLTGFNAVALSCPAAYAIGVLLDRASDEVVAKKLVQEQRVHENVLELMTALSHIEASSDFQIKVVGLFGGRLVPYMEVEKEADKAILTRATDVTLGLFKRNKNDSKVDIALLDQLHNLITMLPENINRVANQFAAIMEGYDRQGSNLSEDSIVQANQMQIKAEVAHLIRDVLKKAQSDTVGEFCHDKSILRPLAWVIKEKPNDNLANISEAWFCLALICGTDKIAADLVMEIYEECLKGALEEVAVNASDDPKQRAMKDNAAVMLSRLLEAHLNLADDHMNAMKQLRDAIAAR